MVGSVTADKDAGKPKPLIQDLAASSLGIEVAVATLLGALLGWWLDGRFHTRPWLMLIGLVAGAIVGWVDVWLQYRRMREAEEEAKKKDA